MGFPVERTTSVEIHHTYARHKEICHHRGLAARDVGMCTCADRLRYVSITSLAQTLALSEICLLLAKDACRNVITICRPVQKIGDSSYVLQLLLSDKYRHIEQKLLLLGMAGLEKRGLPIRWSTQEAIRTLEDVQGAPKIIFLLALAPRSANARLWSPDLTIFNDYYYFQRLLLLLLLRLLLLL